MSNRLIALDPAPCMSAETEAEFHPSNLYKGVLNTATYSQHVKWEGWSCGPDTVSELTVPTGKEAF